MNFNTKDGKSYEIIITYKNNKNMYLRIKKDLKIYITCPKYISKNSINDFITNNYNYIINNLKKMEDNLSKTNIFKYLGKDYQIIYANTNNIIFGTDKVFIGTKVNIDNYLKKEAKKIFLERLNYNYNLFEENIPYPKLRIRKMTSRWGVCNRSLKVITLNLELIKMDIKYLDYVIIHELSHFIYPNHKPSFWSLVEKYQYNYKLLRKEMKN